MQGGHERAWAEALAQEHAHQQGLLATFRGELGAFARECAAALTALDTYVIGIGIADVLTAAKAGHRHAALVLDLGRRLPGLAPATVAEDDELAGLYTGLAEGGDVPPRLVSHAGELLRASPKRTDRELLRAVVDAAGVRSRLEQVLGPAPVAALTALAPLARRLPGLATVGRGEPAGPARTDLAQVLEATAQLTAVEGLAAASDAASLAASLHATVEHVRGAARAVEEGKLEQVLAQARLQLERDLGGLETVLAAAGDAPAEWRAVRRAELEALTEEVREKLERLEKTRRALAALLPHLQTVTRAVATVERLQALEGRLDPGLGAGAEAARLLLLLDLSALLEAIVPAGASPGRTQSPNRGRTRWLVAAALALVAGAGVAIAFAVSGGSGKQAAPTTSAPPLPTTSTQTTVPTPPPPAPTVSPVKAEFVEGQKATFYAVTVRATRQGAPTYTWHLAPPADDPGCNRFGPVPGSPGRAVWHHADTDGCSHTGTEHVGTVTVTVTTTAWRCTATFVGTLTRTGAPPQRCVRIPG